MKGLSLNIDKLSFSYGSQKILEDLTVQFQAGSFVSIIGPNGSGKTTLLKNISAALVPQKGKVLLQGQDVLRIKPKKLARQMAVVPQDTAVNFAFTVFETVLMGRMPYLKRFESESDRDVAVARWAMEVTHTWHLKDRSITEISGGERQRVIVARALAQEPQVILLDEPVAHLDPQHQMELLELLQTLKESKNLTVVTVLHDLNLAAQFSDYVVLLHKGKVFAAGRPEEVLTVKNIEQVYRVEVVIIPNELTGRFNIIPVAKSTPPQGKLRNCRIHLVCGGGSGAFIMDRLVRSGYQVSCGVLNIGDNDWRKARELGIEIAYEAPFSPISEKAYQKNERLLDRADVVVLLSLPFGAGNLSNLEQVYSALKQGKKVLVVGDRNLAGRDFTGGKATDLYDAIVKDGAVLLAEVKDIFNVLETMY
ncbi:MAG: ABC transporter ATP-binding protein [Thermoanaerobacteraceae bacterium]|nr:ABC transporter ATP-binding protein [Thermoanaerobacteraceae bacterium]